MLQTSRTHWCRLNYVVIICKCLTVCLRVTTLSPNGTSLSGEQAASHQVTHANVLELKVVYQRLKRLHAQPTGNTLCWFYGPTNVLVHTQDFSRKEGGRDLRCAPVQSSKTSTVHLLFSAAGWLTNNSTNKSRTTYLTWAAMLAHKNSFFSCYFHCRVRSHKGTSFHFLRLSLKCACFVIIKTSYKYL